jgi:hypothetical protein
MLKCEFSIPNKGTSNFGLVNDRYIYQFKTTNFDEISYHLSKLNLLRIIEDIHDIDEAWNEWNSQVLKVVNEFIPKKKIKSNGNSPWIDGEILHKANIKERLRKIAKKSNKVHDWDKYKQANNLLRNSIRNKYNLFIKNAFDELGSNPKRFWGLINTKSKHKKCNVPHEITYCGISTSDTKTKCDFFNQHFFKSFNTNSYHLPDVTIFRNDNLSSINVSEADVLNVLINLDPSKAYNPDGIPTRVFKECANELYISLTALFNKSLRSGKIPLDWKRADVVPIFKKGDKGMVNNYRPISLLPVASKILERCIFNQINPIVKGDIDVKQHGFMSQKSTVTNLIEFYENITYHYDNKKQTDVVYLDLSKAFDSVPHNLLILRLQTMGFNNMLLAWFRNYLSNRQQRVLLDGCCSGYIKVLSGVPQGSILGPMLFTYFINDMSKCLNNKDNNVFLYADDSKLYNIIRDVDDCIKLQHDLDKLTKWCSIWGLTFNAGKCKIMSFTPSKKKLMYNYKINDAVLERVNMFNDLGVWVQENLKRDKHVTESVKKANMRLGLVKRNLDSNTSTEVKQLCYKSLVRPILEYGSTIWSDNSKKQLKLIEGVQRRATTYIVNDSNISYNDRLLVCGLLPLSYRREYLDAIFMYNNIHGLNICNMSCFVKFNTSNVNTRSAIDDLCIQSNRMYSRNYELFYVNRIRYIWNSIPYYIRSEDLTDTGKNTCFKTNVKKHFTTMLLNEFDVSNSCSWITHCICARCNPFVT